MNEQKNNTISLSEAPKAVQIAVDLIQLLEQNQIETSVAIAALDLVLKDFKKKQDTHSQT